MRKERAGEEEEETPEPQRSARLKGPAPPTDEVMTLWKRVKHLGTLLTAEEVFDANGTSKRVTRVRRSMRM